MSQLLHHLISQQAELQPNKPALGLNHQWLTYEQLNQQVNLATKAFISGDLQAQERVAIYLPKCVENVVAMFATSMARGIFVPLNPVLKEGQVSHILQDCQAKILITNYSRWQRIQSCLPGSIQQVIITDLPDKVSANVAVCSWQDFISATNTYFMPVGLETDIAAIFYTSGSTGKAKGVVLSQRNMVLGAYSVAEYLESCPDDRLLAVQPLSFDYGFSQLSIAFASGASCYLMEYLFPQDIIKLISEQKITSLALVPPLWIKLAELNWPESARNQLRYFTNTGGAMPQATLTKLRALFPEAKPYLMYGLTEAFRSCYLPPEDVDRKPGSFGKAIPNVEIHVINQDGQKCRAGEQGELVHSGPLVSLGYWNNNAKTAERFKPLPEQLTSLSYPSMSVWSGDLVTQDEEGFLYFIGRNDDMIKTSGYRVSPLEVEEVIHDSGLVAEVVAIGVNHQELGQAILVLVVTEAEQKFKLHELKKLCLQQLPNYMQPKGFIVESNLARNANGKIDRTLLHDKYQDYFIR